MGAMSHMENVRRHLRQAAEVRRQNHQDALLAAAVARAQEEAATPPSVPQTGLQPAPGAFSDTELE